MWAKQKNYLKAATEIDAKAWNLLREVSGKLTAVTDMYDSWQAFMADCSDDELMVARQSVEAIKRAMDHVLNVIATQTELELRKRQ
jgi:hypothetical protein